MAVPVGGYYLLHSGFGLSLWLSLALSLGSLGLDDLSAELAQL